MSEGRAILTVVDDLLPKAKPKKDTHDYRKVVVALWGAALTIASRHGIDITDAVIVSTALGVGYVPNGQVR